MTAATSTAVAGALSGVPAVTILCHVRPDADTIGSGLALGLALTRLGTEVEVAFPDTVALPSVLGELPGSKLLVPAAEVVGHPVVVSVDAASLGRLDELAQVFSAAQSSVTIDHHASNDGFGDHDLIDPSADCTAVLVLSVLDELGVEPDNALYVGDRENDMVAADNAGMDGAFIRRSHNQEVKLDRDPAYEIESLTELRNL